MKHGYLILVLFFQFDCIAQRVPQTTTAFNTLMANNATAETNTGTFITMESVRYGLAAPLKGVQVTINNATCPGQPSYISLSNPSGESWKYSVFSGTGQLYSEGETGYQRRIPIMEPGRYMVKFTHQSGVVAFDEISLRTPAPFTATIEMDSAPVYQVGQPIKFLAASPAATELTWEMGDGKTYHDATVVEHVFQTPGEFRIMLRANNWDCEALTEKVIAVGVAVAGMQPEN